RPSDCRAHACRSHGKPHSDSRSDSGRPWRPSMACAKQQPRLVPDAASDYKLPSFPAMLMRHHRYPSGGEYSRWLRETVGALRVARPEVIEAIISLQLPIATTNYDSLIEQVSGLPQVTWKDGVRVERLLRGDDPGVLHLHGYWGDPSSVVLGISSHEKVLGDEHAQAMQHALRAFRTLLFVGCGAGLADPNFGALLRWSREVFEGSEYRHFRLAINTEVTALQQQHPRAERIFVIGFGPSHSDLAPFLRRLAP